MKRIVFFIILLLIVFFADAQQRYWVIFKDKHGVKFDPYSYFDPKAINRRIKNGISLYDSTDFPVNQQYINAVSKIADSINVVTRWFNGVSVIVSDGEIDRIAQLSCVKEIQPIIMIATPAMVEEDFDENKTIELASRQLKIMQGKKFIDKGINGKGVRIAVFDAGFPGVDKNPIFKHLWDNKQILKTYDFAKKKDFVFKYNHHGTMVLSCIAGIYGKINIGLATGAEFLLARTEVNSEPFSEEENWLAAAEWADKNGADIISSSLGYTVPRYFQYQMDGTTSFVAKAAKMASDKGILVVNAMGNDGDGNWKVVGTPADVPEVLSVGGVDPYTKFHIKFSSFGPTSAGVLKPEICASGFAAVASLKNITTAYGTSFATPLITGFAACVLQTDTSLTGQQLKQKIIESGSLYPYADYANGYGIPQAGRILDTLHRTVEKTFEVEIKKGYDFTNFKFTFLTDTAENEYFYCEFLDSDQKILKYLAFKVEENELSYDLSNSLNAVYLKAHYQGYTYETKIE